MKPTDFFETVTRPNIHTAIDNDHDYRLAVNAVLSIDAAYGVLFEHLKDLQHPFLKEVKKTGKETTDADFKNHIAAMSPEFQIVRDTAFATKHGRLNNKTPRLVKAADEMSSEVLVCGLFACGDPLGGSAVFVQVDGTGFERVWYLLRKVELFTDDIFKELGI